VIPILHDQKTSKHGAAGAIRVTCYEVITVSLRDERWIAPRPRASSAQHSPAPGRRLQH